MSSNSSNGSSSSSPAVVNDGGGESRQEIEFAYLIYFLKSIIKSSVRSYNIVLLSWLTTLFNMDGSLDSTEIAFLWLVIFGVLVLFGFVIYLLCRSFILMHL